MDEPERYVTRAELARLMGIHVHTLDLWRAEGMPHETWGVRTIRFLPSQALAWARERGAAARSGAERDG